MRTSVRVLSTSIACLSWMSLASAQTTTTPEPPFVQPSAAAGDQVQNFAPTTLPPTAPVTPVVPGTAPVAQSPSTAISPPPPAPVVPPRTRTSDCVRNGVRDGFYLRFGNGFGGVNVAGNGPRGTASLSGLGSNSLVAIGGSLGHGIVLAGTIQSSTVTATFTGGPFVGENVTSNGKSLIASPKADASSSQLGLLVDWYPNPADGWHVGLSGGAGIANVRNHADDSTMTGTSMAGSLFGGYDWAISPEWSIGLAFVGSGARSASMKDSSDKSDTGYRLKAYFLGISGSFLYF
jgi:hypothetical protein